VEGARKPPLALLPKTRYFQGIKLGFDRPLQHIRAGAPRYKGARPYLCGRSPESGKMPSLSQLHAFSLPVTCLLTPCYMPSHSLLPRTFFPVPTYTFDKGFPILSFFSSLSFIIGIFFVYLHPQSARSAKTYCSIDSLSPPEKKRANIHYWGCPSKGADFPYMYVACGEPRVVWRRSAPHKLKTR